MANTANTRVTRHHNFNFTGLLPTANDDKYYSEDLIRDYYNQKEDFAHYMTIITGNQNCILKGLIPSAGTAGTGDKLNLTTGAFITFQQCITPVNYTALPPTVSIKAIPVFVDVQVALSDFVCPSINKAGVGNYIKINFSETETSLRNKATIAGSYNSEVDIGYILTVDTVVPTGGEMLLGTCTSNGTTITITGITENLNSVAKSDTIIIASYDSEAASKISSDYVLSATDDAAAVINRYQATLAGGGTIKLKEGTFNFATQLSLLTKISLVGCGASTYLTATSNLTTMITCSTYNRIRDVRIAAVSNTIGTIINGNAKDETNKFHNITISDATTQCYYNCNNLSLCSASITTNTTANCFNTCDQLSNCFGKTVGTGVIYVFCAKLSACNASVTANTTAGCYDTCIQLSTCTGGTIGTGPVFKFCNNLGECYTALTTAAIAFNTCNQLSSCTATTTSTATLYYTCKNITSCSASITAVTTAICFDTCKHVSSCEGTTLGTGGIFKSCIIMSACKASVTTNTAAVCYNACTNISSCYGETYGTGIVFTDSGYMASCTGSIKTNTTQICFMRCSNLSSCTGDTAGSGYVFSDSYQIIACNGQGTNVFTSCSGMTQNMAVGSTKYNASTSDSGAVYPCADTPDGGFNH